MDHPCLCPIVDFVAGAFVGATPSPHTVQFVTVDKDVKLEVLDWGGTGRPLVLLAGLGNTAHVFDDFAPKLTNEYHVYGITRRGFGASSAPAPSGGNYSADRLGNDVLAVLDSLKIERPLLAGHSIAGEELSSLGTRHPERFAGLIYLEAAYAYAYEPPEGTASIDLQGLEEKLGRSPSKNVARLVRPEPTAADLASFAAFRSWQARVIGYAMPEAELRQIREATPEGRVGKERTEPNVAEAIVTGTQKYTDIRVPVLAIFADPPNLGPFANNSAFEAIAAANTEASAKALETGLPYALVVRVARANHMIFLSNEADVLREMRRFIAGLSLIH